MASSFIDFKKKGFWISDGLMEPTLLYLYDQILKKYNNEKWLLEMGEKLKYNAWGYFMGCMNLRLDTYLTNSERLIHLYP